MLSRTRIKVRAALSRFSPSKRTELFIFLAAIALVTAVLALVFVRSSWDFRDWTGVFYPAAGSPLDPYGISDPFYLANPPWLVWILYPFSLFPVELSFALWIILTILISAWCIFRLGGNLTIVLLSLCTPAFARVFIQGQVEILPLLGFTLMLVSPKIFGKTAGYLLLAIKPQVLGLGALSAWLQLERKDKVVVLLAVLAVVLISLLLYGNWPSILYSNMAAIAEAKHGIHIWPYGVPIGLILLGLSLRRKDAKLGGLSTLFFIPYVGLHSLFPYIAVLFTMIPRIWAIFTFLFIWGLALLAT